MWWRAKDHEDINNLVHNFNRRSNDNNLKLLSNGQSDPHLNTLYWPQFVSFNCWYCLALIWSLLCTIMWVLLRWYLNHSIFARIHVMAIRIIQFLFGVWRRCGKVFRQNTWPFFHFTHWFVFYYFYCRVMYLERPEITRKQEVSCAQWFCELVWWYAETWTAVLLFLGSTVLESCFLFARLQTKQKIKSCSFTGFMLFRIS